VSKIKFSESGIAPNLALTTITPPVYIVKGKRVMNFAAGRRIGVTWPFPINSKNVKENRQNKFFIKQKLNIQPNGCTFVINLQTVLWI
jgi:hypothetical protein